MPRKYVFALVVITLIFFGGIFLLVSLLSGGGDNEPNQPEPTQQTNKLSTDGNEVRYTTYGRVVGEEERRAIRITVNDAQRTLQILQGYDENVIKSYTFSNTSTAFDNYLLALENANFTLRDPRVTTDDRGLCPLGNRFVFETEYDDNSEIRTFTTSCTDKGASFKGNRGVVDALFKAQIPEYQTLVQGVVL